jgi:hypothetical protein
MANLAEARRRSKTGGGAEQRRRWAMAARNPPAAIDGMHDWRRNTWLWFLGISGRKWGGEDSGGNGDGERDWGFSPIDARAINEGSNQIYAGDLLLPDRSA